MNKDLFDEKPWWIVHPDGTREFIMNLNQFCRKHNLSASNMQSVAKGDRNHCKGFKAEKPSWANM